MSGRGKFQRQIEETIGGIRVVQTVIAKVLNLDDPDVRYACASGLISAGPDYVEVMRRGREKAQTSFEGMPESLTLEAKNWAASLAPFSGTTLHVEIDGRYDREPMGRAALKKDGPSFHFTPDGIVASLEEPGPDGQTLGVSKDLQPGADLQAWLKEARSALVRARVNVEELRALGVTVGE
jgi:hypothetical protein